MIADGDVPTRATLDAAWPEWMDGIQLVVAADGGWEKATTIGIRPDLLVGDGDSLPEGRFAELAAEGVAIERAAVAKDESDAELAIQAALLRGATHVTIVGALGGGRLDHALANIGLLALPNPADAEIELLDETTRVRLLRAPDERGRSVTYRLVGPVGELVSLLPQGMPAVGVTTAGLLYPLNDETLEPGPARGLSNVATAAEASVTLRSGCLLVIETRSDQPMEEKR
ncbi:MAG TPA: thiamine diphosphokinase [Candidatus Limnocylindrales bacterium]